MSNVDVMGSVTVQIKGVQELQREWKEKGNPPCGHPTIDKEYYLGAQTKCYSNSVGNKAIQEVIAGLGYYKLDKGIVITNNYFTNSAIDLAKSSDVILWVRNILKEKLLEL